MDSNFYLIVAGLGLAAWFLPIKWYHAGLIAGFLNLWLNMDTVMELYTVPLLGEIELPSTIYILEYFGMAFCAAAAIAGIVRFIRGAKNTSSKFSSTATRFGGKNK